MKWSPHSFPAWLAVACVWLAADVLCVAAGMRCDINMLRSSWQVPDVDVLRADPFRVLAHLHAQPPLLGAVVAALLRQKLVPPDLAMSGLWRLTGLGTALALLGLLRELRVPRSWAVAVASAFAVSPQVLLYTRWPFYAAPSALLLTTWAWCLAAWLQRRGRWLHGAMTSLGLLCALWSLWHPLLVPLFAGWLAWRVAPESRRAVARAAALPTLVLAVIVARRWASYRLLTLSSWAGMNAWALCGAQVPPPVLAAEVARRVLPPVAAVPRFSALAAYPAELTRVVPTGVAALDEPTRQDGTPNFHHVAYVGIGKAYLAASAQAAVLHPGACARGLAIAWFSYLQSATDYPPLTRNRALVAAYADVWDHTVFGRVDLDLRRLRDVAWLAPWLPDPHHDRPRYAYLFLLIGLPLTLWGAVRAARHGEPELRATLVALVGAVLWLAVVGNIMEVGENNRFRFTTDPIVLALATHLIWRAWSARRRPDRSAG